MKKLLKKKVNVFGKGIPVFVIALVLLTMGLASAGLLSYYGMVIGTVTVDQSLVISTDGQNWKECTEGNYENCKVTSSIETVAGTTKDFVGGNYKFYLKNNLPVEGAWDYIYFKWEYEIPENLFDGLTSLTVHWTTYSSSASDPEECDGESDILPITKELWVCVDSICTFEVPDELGEGMIQKFCGTTMGLNPATIPGIYTTNINIVPA